MKIFTYILIAAAAALLTYNITKINFESPLQGDSSVALIGVVACLCAIVLLLILLVSKKIAEKSKRSKTH